MRQTLLIIGLIAAAAPLAAQDYHFSRQLAQGARLEIDNINGPIDVTPATGRTAEVTVTKIVKEGDGALVKAIMEQDGGGMRVCTIYLNRDAGRNSCNGNNSDNSNDRNSRSRSTRLDVEMRYLVRVPVGALLTVDNVNGNVSITGAGVESKIATVNGDIRFDGIGASSLETVNGKIVGAFSRASWEGTMDVQTVNGSVELTFPAGLNANVSGEVVSGSINSDFPITIEKGFGPKSFSGRIGTGGRRLKIETVNGAIRLVRR
jgi:Putative adhesin